MNTHNLQSRTHKEILLDFLSDGEWHSMPELMKKFQDLKFGAFWAGFRARISDIKKNNHIERRIKSKNNNKIRYAEYRLVL